MSDSLTISPLNMGQKSLLSMIRKTFHLDEAPFDDMDDDLLMLAFSTTCSVSFNRKFGVCDHQTLEFFGDRHLYSICADIIYDYYGLSGLVPYTLTKLISELTNNRAITDLMLMPDNSCEYVRSPRYKINNSKHFHNKCGDTLEAIVGALHIHLRTNHPEIDSTAKLKDWLMYSTYFPLILKNAVVQLKKKHGIKDIIVFLPNDPDEITEGLEEEYDKIKDKDDDTPSQMKAFDYEEGLYSVASSSLIIEHDYNLIDIYQALGWKYVPPVPEGTVYAQHGGENLGERFGYGYTPEEAMLDALGSLYVRGYIIPMDADMFTFSNSRPPAGKKIRKAEDIKKKKTNANNKNVRKSQ